MKRLFILAILSALPMLLRGQDTLQAGTFVVRKVHVGDMIPSGLDFLGNMGGTPSGGISVDNIIIKGRVLRVYVGDTTPIRSASVWLDGGNAAIKTDSIGNFKLAIPQSGNATDSVKIKVRHQTDWDTTVTVLFASNHDDFVVTRFIPNAGGGGAGMSRRDRRREILKRIFYPWKWFQKKEKLPPREKRRPNKEG